MALQDRVQEETSERKNALEAYIYSLRNKLSDVLTPYVTEEDRAALLDRLEKAEVRPPPLLRTFSSSIEQFIEHELLCYKALLLRSECHECPQAVT